MGLFAAAFDARESAHLRPRIRKDPPTVSHTTYPQCPTSRETTSRAAVRAARAIASETDLFSEPSARPIAAAPSLCAIRRNLELVELTGVEPATPCLQSRCSPS